MRQVPALHEVHPDEAVASALRPLQRDLQFASERQHQDLQGAQVSARRLRAAVLVHGDSRQELHILPVLLQQPAIQVHIVRFSFFSVTALQDFSRVFSRGWKL